LRGLPGGQEEAQGVDDAVGPDGVDLGQVLGILVPDEQPAAVHGLAPAPPVGPLPAMLFSWLRSWSGDGTEGELIRRSRRTVAACSACPDLAAEYEQI
jgi:hypothetical protein